MHKIAVAIIGWAFVVVGAFGSLNAMESEGKAQGGGWLLIAGVILVIARGVAVRFDRINPPRS